MIDIERYGLFALNCFSFFVTGFSGNTGSAIPELVKIYDVTLVQLSYSMTLGSIFFCLGSFSATFTLEKWNRQLQFAFVLFLVGIAKTLTPISLTINNYYILVCMICFFGNVAITVPNVTTIELFPGKSSFYLQLQNFFYSIGGILTPLLFAPFLNENISGDTVSDSFDSSSNRFSTESRLWIPYLIIGSLEFTVFVLTMIAYFVKPYQVPKKKNLKIKVNIKDEKSEIELESNNNTIEIEKNDFEKNYNEKNLSETEEKKKENLSQKHIAFFLGMSAILVALQIGNESNSGSFIPSYLLKSSLNLDAKQAAYITITLPVFTAIGRFITSILTLKFKIENLIVFNYVLVFIGNILLFTLGIKIYYMAFISLAVIGLGFSSTVPLMFCYIENNISLTTRYSSIINFVVSLNSCVSPLIISNFIENNPNNFIIYNLIVAVIMLTVFTSLRVFKDKF